MTLDQFIARKPKELRLGQFFVNSYWKGSDKTSQELYHLDGYGAELYIVILMEKWQWESLPELE
jgi:hypothetical protein